MNIPQAFDIQKILDRITDGFIALDKNFCYTYVNKKAGELVRRDPLSLIGKNVWEEFPEAVDSSTYYAFLQAMNEQNYIVNRDYFPPLDLWQENHIYPSPEGLFIFIRNITEQKRAEDKIRLKVNLLNAVGQAVIATDMDGIINYWNNAAEKMYGWSMTEVIGNNITQLVTTKDRRDKIVNKVKALDNGNSWSEEVVVCRKDKNSFPAFITSSALPDEAGKLVGIIEVSIDISERKMAEANLKLLENKIVEQKIQEQKKISRAIIHAQEKEKNYIGLELHDNANQILAGAKIYLTVAANNDKNIKKILEYPMQLISSSMEAIRMLSHKQATPLKNINLEQLVRGLLKVFHKDKRTNSDFVYLVSGHLFNDGLKLNIYRIIQELVINIIKHAAAKNINISIKEKDNNIEIIVTDDGKGFDVNSKRNGIGISNIINRIEAFNGAISIKSSPGNGCQTIVSMPMINTLAQVQIE
ncbi:MAG: PAS domain S-box protein [Ferruginibacter sp.]